MREVTGSSPVVPTTHNDPKGSFFCILGKNRAYTARRAYSYNHLHSAKRTDRIFRLLFTIKML